MPTPPLPSRDDDEHGAMPADCRVETLRAWLLDIYNHSGPFLDGIARAVRALVEAKCRETYDAAMLDVDAQCDCDSSGFGSAWVTQDEGKDLTVSRVLGSAS